MNRRRNTEPSSRRTSNSIQETIRLVIIIIFLVLIAFGLRKCVVSVGGGGSTNPNKSEEKSPLTKKEKESLEAQRKEEYGEFYVPLPEESREKKEIGKVKGLYVSADVAAMAFEEKDIDSYAKSIEQMMKDGKKIVKPESVNTLEAVLAMAKATEINALVIDVKTDWGTLAWNTEVPIAKELGVAKPVSGDDFKALLDYMEKNDIYKMARIVTFKDPVLPEKKPEHAMQLNSGGIYRDNDGNAWVNPFDEYVWKYVVAVSKEAINKGFDEIHFDYVRFPDGARTYNKTANFPGRNDRPKDIAITSFLQYAREELKDYPGKTSAAIFGTTTMNWEDIPDDIGQGFLKVSNNADRVSPMVYPSHFSEGWFGFDVPDANPYGVLQKAMAMSIEKNAALPRPAEITPWIQAFTASWVKGYIKYDPPTIAEQIRGSQSSGVDSYLLWNSSSAYDPEIFKYKAEKRTREEGKDLMGRTPKEAAEMYFKALAKEDFQKTYLLSSIHTRKEIYEEYAEVMKKSGIQLTNYKVNEVDDEHLIAKVTLSYIANGKKTDNENLEIKLVLENGMYKVQTPNFLGSME